MITTSACRSPDSEANARAGSDVAAHSEFTGASAVQSGVATPLMRCSASDGRVSERLQGREMEVGFGQLLDFGRAAESRYPLAPLDPAHFVAEPACDPDVVVLALSHMQN